METVEEIEQIDNVVVVNNQPEFTPNFNEKINARYFVICESEMNSGLPQNAYECVVCGLTLAEWVQRACVTEPVVLRVNEGDDILPLIKPYIQGYDYSVVLYASTPFVRKQHINDLLGFAVNKHLSACKLKKGFIFKNDYILRVDQIFSIDTYDFASNDFFEVKTLRDLEYAEIILSRRVIEFHRKNHVLLAGRKVTIDATAELGYKTSVAGGAAILKKTKIGANTLVSANATISGSKIGDDVSVGEGAIIEDSVIKDGAIISSGACVVGSVIGENCVISSGAKIMHSGLKQKVNVGECATLIGARVAEDACIKNAAKVIIAEEPTVVLSGATIGEGAVVYDVTVPENYHVAAFSTLTKSDVGE